MAETPRLAKSASVTDGSLMIDWQDGRQQSFHPLWLRERLPVDDILDPRTGQRLIEAGDLPLDLELASVALSADERIALTFSDSYQASVTSAWLRDIARPIPARQATYGQVAPDLQLWDNKLTARPEADLLQLQRNEAAVGSMLQDLNRFGFMIVHNVPVEMEGAKALTDCIGPIRITNWGGLADVKAIPKAYDLTMTTRGLEQHADNPYRTPVPGYIFLHCLRNDAEGGESVIVDGFRVASEVLARDPNSFDALTTIRPRFRYADSTAILESDGPLIELDGDGRLHQIRYSNRTEMVDHLSHEALDRYYKARQLYFRLLNDPALVLTFKLEPGDCMIMDNYRLLHGRKGFKLDTGMRHMRQCYMDRDTVGSKRKVLARENRPLAAE
ncbi:MAG TPA: TauD/TfdA family dioxygenase [Dongiaceae bacterium]|nr:TauD/TfdA family dioxygenase [Dongiaceae bacterium]